MKRVLIIGNEFAHGGRAKAQIKAYAEFLKLNSDIISSTYSTRKSYDVEGMEKAIINFQPQIISIIGGDGTVNDVLNVAEARLCKIHLIPAGSGNDFSKLINGEMTEADSFALVRSENYVECDTGICNGRYFLNGVGIGFDGSVARETVHMKLPFSTRWKYWIAILKNVLLYKSTKMSLHFNGSTQNSKVFMLSMANGREYGGGFRVSPLSDPSDGLLNLVIINDIKPFARLKYIPIVEKGEHLGLDIVQHITTRRLEIKSDEVLHAHLDGELMSSASYEIVTAEKIKLISWE